MVPSKTLKRKGDDAKDISKEAVGEKRVSTGKAKRQKVLLNVRSSQSIPGKVFVFGQNCCGQLGLEEVEKKVTPVLLELPEPIVDIATGRWHSVCLTESGEVMTFGCHISGALGRIIAEEDYDVVFCKVEIPEKIVQISAGYSHTAALTESGQVYLWGNFMSGVMSMGLTVGGSPQQTPIKILDGITVIKIVSGDNHLVCLTNEGNVYTCGCGENGQLGRVSERLCHDGGRRGLSLLLEPAVVLIGRQCSIPVVIDDVWAGSDNTFLKAQDTGLIYAFGSNNCNKLGYENETVSFVPKQVASFNGKAWLQITSGEAHTLALDDGGRVYAVGQNEFGQLGTESVSENIMVPTAISTLEKVRCATISCGHDASFAVAQEGSLYSWGKGTGGYVLGHGTHGDCPAPRIISGKDRNFIKSWKAFKLSAGGYHTLILASQRENA